MSKPVYNLGFGVKMTITWKKCTHEKINVGKKSNYCPDCGEYVENHWYVTRCKCCGIRHKTIIYGKKPIPSEKFCKNCGSEEFIIEEIETPDIVSINYAAFIKQSYKVSAQNLVQSWIDKKVFQNYGMLPLHN